MIGGGFGGFRLHRYGGIVPILVIRSIIQIGVTVRIAVGIPVNRPDKLLKKEPMVAIREPAVFIVMKETPVLIKCETTTEREVMANSVSHPECRAGAVRNEPTPKTVTVDFTAGRGRVRGGE
jgi:hypothetical protein